jgi:hypothetical protein
MAREEIALLRNFRKCSRDRIAELVMCDDVHVRWDIGVYRILLIGELCIFESRSCRRPS